MKSSTYLRWITAWWITAAAILAFGVFAKAQTPAGVINAPIYATGYISQGGGTNVTTNIPPQPNHPTNLNIYTTGAILGTWTIKLPNPAFEGQMLSFSCGAAANAISVTSSDGSSIDSTIPSTCSINSGFAIQFDQRSNIWRNSGSNNTSTFKPFTGVTSQWPWQLNADGTWTSKQPAFSDISGVASANQIPAPTTSTSFRNRLTNANFDIWQRGTSFTVPTGSLVYTADRWFIQNDSGSNITATQAAAPTGFRGLNSLRIQATMGAGSVAGWGQRFEGQMVRDLDGKDIVVSFDLSQSLSGGATATWYLQIFGNTALDNGTFNQTLFSGTFTPPASAGMVSVIVPAANTVGLKYGAHFRIIATRTSGSGTLDAYLGSVQFEQDRLVGGNWNNPTPFEFRPLPVELTMSRRFYQRVPLQGVLGEAVASDIIFCSLKFEEMRATPTATLLKTSVSGATFDLSVGWNFVTASGLSITNYGAQPKSASFQWSGFSGLTVGGLAAGNDIGDLVELSAEL